MIDTRNYVTYDIIGAVDAGECDAAVRFPWSWEVDAFKTRLLSVVTNLNETAKGCNRLPPEERAAWNAFYELFTKFASTPTSTFGAYGEWVTTCGYSRYLDAWLAKFKSYGCRIIGPENVSSGSAGEYLKWIAIGAGVVGIAALAITFAPEIKAVTRRRG